MSVMVQSRPRSLGTSAQTLVARSEHPLRIFALLPERDRAVSAEAMDGRGTAEIADAALVSISSGHPPL